MKEIRQLLNLANVQDSKWFSQEEKLGFKNILEAQKERKGGVCMLVRPECQCLAENKPSMGLKAQLAFLFLFFNLIYKPIKWLN